MDCANKKVVLIANPIAGNGQGLKIAEKVSRMLATAGFECTIRPTEHGGHAAELAREAACKGTDVVVAIGGDGTVNEVARGLLKSDSALGIIPCGSGNGLAFHLGIPTDVNKAVEILKNGEIHTIDSGVINGKPFFCTCGVGYDAKVAYEYAQTGTRGLATYVKETLACWQTYEPQEYVITADKEVIRTKALLVTCANANQWGNHCHIAPKASLTDGLLEVTIVLPVNIPDGIALACRLPGYKLNDDKHVISLNAKSVTIERRQKDVAHFDGEAYMEEATIHAATVPQSLKVITSSSSL